MPENQRAHRYRLLAMEIRAAAEDMKHPRSRETLMRIAQNYDYLADTVELVGITDGEIPSRKA